MYVQVLVLVITCLAARSVSASGGVTVFRPRGPIKLVKNPLGKSMDLVLDATKFTEEIVSTKAEASDSVCSSTGFSCGTSASGMARFEFQLEVKNQGNKALETGPPPKNPSLTLKNGATNIVATTHFNQRAWSWHWDPCAYAWTLHDVLRLEICYNNGSRVGTRSVPVLLGSDNSCQPGESFGALSCAYIDVPENFVREGLRAVAIVDAGYEFDSENNRLEIPLSASTSMYITSAYLSLVMALLVLSP